MKHAVHTRLLPTLVAALLILAASGAARAAAPSDGWKDDFGIAQCTMSATGRNAYFVLEPGHQLVLQGASTKMHVTVLDETKVVDGVTTRVVEEREWKRGKLAEVSRNYYAMCEQSKDVLHFGEDVQVFDANGKFLKTEGTWLAGVNGHRPGLVIPGSPTPRMRFYQEIAPGVSLNRGEIVSMSETCKTQAGTFSRCMKVKGTSAMDATKLEYKYYAPDIGLVDGDGMRLVSYGPVKK